MGLEKTHSVNRDPTSLPSSVEGEVAADAKTLFEKPNLKYIPPKLVKNATVEDVTAGFFGTFYP